MSGLRARDSKGSWDLEYSTALLPTQRRFLAAGRTVEYGRVSFVLVLRTMKKCPRPLPAKLLLIGFYDGGEIRGEGMDFRPSHNVFGGMHTPT